MSSHRFSSADISATAITTGLVAVLVSYTGPFLVVLQAANAAHLTVAETTSWVWAISLGSGVTCALLSWLTKQPVITAWSTPGAALLVTVLGNYSFSDAIGAYLVAGVLAMILGYSGLLGKLLDVVPSGILSAVLAGVLLPFVLKAALAVGAAPVVAGGLFLAFLVGRRYVPRYAVLLALIVGVLCSIFTGALGHAEVVLTLDAPKWTTPTFSPAAILGIGLPMLLVTMASQNAPGLTVIRNDGYEPNTRLLVGGTATAWVVLAPFGAHAINLAAITAAICTGRESHEDPRRRYVAGIACGTFYIALSFVSSGLVLLFQSVPSTLVAALAGVALLGALLGACRDAFSATGGAAEAALIALGVTASGLTAFTIASPFWGIVAGAVAYLVLVFPRSRDNDAGTRVALTKRMSGTARREH